MGYDLHITRRENWSSEGNDITTQEWLDYIEKDPELSLYGQNGPYFAIWKTEESQREYWMDWSEGEIFTKNPDQILIDKLVKIARHLNAVVQGDDGELYGENTQTIDKSLSDLTVNKKESWFKKIFGRK